ncbi:hypothetical protein MXD81_24435, partial [Microbacteriaceae bacterium K1510]|nr:hypothetical protein [Microbacteriaceae bacterium K1510]
QDPRTAHRQHDTTRSQHRKEDCAQPLKRGDRTCHGYPESTTVRADSGIRRAATPNGNPVRQPQFVDDLLEEAAPSLHGFKQFHP